MITNAARRAFVAGCIFFVVDLTPYPPCLLYESIDSIVYDPIGSIDP
jgi:hypothetical protein